MDLQNLQIKRMISHEIFQKDISGNRQPPNYSTVLIAMNQRGKDELTSRMISVLGNFSHSIEMFIQNDEIGSVYSKISSITTNDDNTFISASKEIANKLSNSQNTRKIPGGIIIVLDGTVGIDNKYFICIIKAELHGGFSKKVTPNNITIEYLGDLLLTPQQKLYKIAFFVKNFDNNNKDDFSALVFDHNMTQGETRSAASYFYDIFLGCVFNPSDKKLTRDFYYYTKEYINNTSTLNDEEKLDINQGLYTYLKVKNSDVIEVAGFAEEYITSENRDDFINFMESKEFPMNLVNKNLEYIKTKLKRRGIHFTSKVKIFSPSENFEDLIQIIESVEDTTTLKIKGTIERQD